MGIGKLGKKLIKVARKAEETGGKRGRELAEAVLERAISILKAEMKARPGRAPDHGGNRSAKTSQGPSKSKTKPLESGGSHTRPKARTVGAARSGAPRSSSNKPKQVGDDTPGRDGDERNGPGAPATEISSPAEEEGFVEPPKA